MSKLEFQERDHSLSIAIFSKEKTDDKGKTTPVYGACLQRSYFQKEKQDWKREQINLFPEELLDLGNLCLDVYNTYRKLAQAKNKERQEAREYPAQAYNDPAPSSFGEPPAYLNDDPFGL